MQKFELYFNPCHGLNVDIHIIEYDKVQNVYFAIYKILLVELVIVPLPYFSADPRFFDARPAALPIAFYALQFPA